MYLLHLQGQKVRQERYQQEAGGKQSCTHYLLPSGFFLYLLFGLS
jgi:hypothetical protein